MRTPEVEIAISNTKAGVYCTDDADTLADEVERLEGRLKQTEDIAAQRMESCATMLKRAEAAEARVKELEAEALNGRHAVFTDLKAQLAAANDQNARLRAALEYVSLLAHCISKAGPLNTPDLETAWRKFDLISVKAAEALVDRKAALNGEETKHCADCDWTFPCWQTGAGCRKRPQGEEAST